jgi:RNA polymerase sigma factor (sigma-70 family)
LEVRLTQRWSHRPSDPDTEIGGPAAGFPATEHGVLADVASPDPERRRGAQDALVRAYWKPAYKYVRLRWNASNEDAKDLVQSFFARALEKGFFDGYDPQRARFRTFLRTCLDGFLANERRAAGRLKRGGGYAAVDLDAAVAEAELAVQPTLGGAEVDDWFRRELLRSVLALAVEDLRARCEAAGQRVRFTVFERYDLADAEPAADQPPVQPTYAELAGELGIPETQVTNHLSAARRLLRQAALERLRELCANEEEFRVEARELLGSAP